MEQNAYQAQYAAFSALTEQCLGELSARYLPAASRIGQAAQYSLLGGGKRVRAVLTLASCQLAGGDPAKAAD